MTIENKPKLRIIRNTESLAENLNINKDRLEFFRKMVKTTIEQSETRVSNDFEQLWETAETIEEYTFLIYAYGRVSKALEIMLFLKASERI